MNSKHLLVSGFMCCVAIMLISTPAVHAQPQAICVPWVPSLTPEPPHWTYSGAETRVKGISRAGATEYRWDFGDGNSTSWTAIGNSYNLEALHIYTGINGQEFTATLYVKDGSGQEDQDTYPIKIFESTDLSDPNHLDVRINMAVDEGLWWLHKTMIRGTYGGGSPGYDQPYGWWDVSGGAEYDVPAAGAAVDAFQLRGHKVIGDYDGDPYVETVGRGLNYLLCHTYDYTINDQPYGDPDTNGNDIGLVINYTDDLYDSRQTYIGGICAITLASSGAPNRIASCGGAYVYDRPYHQIVQDMVDFFAFGQVDSGDGRGGWRYYANYDGADMSTTQWPVLAMLAGEQPQPRGMDSTVPQFVRDELPNFLYYTRHDACDTYYGGYGYSDDSNHINCLKAAAGIICWEWLPTPLTDPEITGALGYFYRHWNDDGYPPGENSWQDQPIHGNSYGMYAVMKAMRIPEPDMEVIVDYNDPPSDCADLPTGNTLDWYYSTGSGSPQGAAQAYYQEGLAHYSVRNQHADGSWDDTTGPNPVYDAFATGWQILLLGEGVTNPQPVAVICDCDEQEYNLNQDIDLDGSCSYHVDPMRAIVSYEWDFEYDGTFVTDATGVNVTIVGGYSEEGIYPVALRVTDDNPNPQTDIYVCNIDVHPPPHCPHAFADGPYIGWVNVPVTFDASASWDPDNEIVSYEWDLDNDELYGADDGDCFGEPSDAVGINPQWTWDAPYGVATIGLKVTDAAGEFEACSDWDWSTVAIGNHPPVSDPDGPYEAPPDSTIMLNGCDSYDPDPGDTITFAWDLDSDGEFDDGSTCEVPFTVGSVGTVYDVCLKVTDSFDEYDITCTTVEVVPYQVESLIIKQGACPAPMNRNSHGVLPVLLTGDVDFDVYDVDLASVRLSRADGVGGEVAPNDGPPGPRIEFKDLNHPYVGEGPCSCNDDQSSDGIMDLSLAFRTDDLVEALELDELPSGAIVILMLSGTLSDGCEFIAQDCVQLVPPGRGPGLLAVTSNLEGAWVNVTPLDKQLDGGGFANFERTFRISTDVTVTPSTTHMGRPFQRWRLDGVLQRVGQLTIEMTVIGDAHNLEAIYRNVGPSDQSQPGAEVGAEQAEPLNP